MSVNPRSAAALAAIAALLAGAPASPARSCAFDNGAAGVFGATFNAEHPKFSLVYFAIVDAVDQGLLEKTAFEPITPGPTGYWRAVGRLQDIQRRLSAVAAARSLPRPAISLVFIESKLWARFEPRPQGFSLTPHAAGPVEGDVVLFTSEGGIAAVLEGRISPEAALDRGLIAIDGEAGGQDVVGKLLAAALAPAASPSPGEGGRSAPMRLFGPSR